MEKRLRSLVHDSLQKHGINCEKFTLTKRTRDFRDGEFVVPAGCLSCSPDSSVLKSVQHTLQQETANDLLPIGSVTQSQHYSLALHIQHSAAFCNVVSKAVTEGGQYGLCPKTAGNHAEVVLNVPELRGLDNTEEENPQVTLSQLRAVVLTQHAALLLQAHGFAVSCLQPKQLPAVLRDLVGEELDIPTKPVPPPSPETCKAILKKCRDCQYRERQDSQAPSPGAGEAKLSPDCGRDCDRVVLNVQRFMEDKGVAVGKTAFDRNIGFVEVADQAGLTPVGNLAAALDSAFLHGDFSQPSSLPVCLHLVPHCQQFQQQQADLVWSMLSQNGNKVLKSYLVYGPAFSRKNSAESVGASAEDYCRLRHEQIKEAAQARYEDEVNESDWRPVLSNLTAASINFDLLCTMARNTVKVDLSTRENADNRVGAFVLYNCARLSMLQQHFQDAVLKGTYPPLPPLEKVQFQLLTEKDEWTLLFSYIYAFPAVVDQSVQSLAPCSTDIHAKLHTHKVANLLVSMCRCLSTYYSRTHVLGEAKTHLLPVMYARLYLMKAAHVVLSNGLRLLGLVPPTQL